MLRRGICDLGRCRLRGCCLLLARPDRLSLTRLVGGRRRLIRCLCRTRRIVQLRIGARAVRFRYVTSDLPANGCASGCVCATRGGNFYPFDFTRIRLLGFALGLLFDRFLLDRIRLGRDFGLDRFGFLRTRRFVFNRFVERFFGPLLLGIGNEVGNLNLQIFLAYGRFLFFFEQDGFKITVGEPYRQT